MRFAIGIFLLLVGICCVATAVIWQQVLCYQMFGAIFSKIFIPHYSAWLYLGGIPMIIGSLMCGIEIN